MIPKHRTRLHLYHTHGYTMIEVLVALSIMLILISGSYISYTNILSKWQEVDIQTLTQMLREARLGAIRLQKPVGLCALNARNECVKNQNRTIAVFVQYTQKRVVLARYTLKHPNAQLLIIGSRSLPLLRFEASGHAPTFGSAYYCLPAKHQSLVPRLIVNLSGHIKQSFSDDRTRCTIENP